MKKKNLTNFISYNFKSRFRNAVKVIAIPIQCSIRIQIFGMIEACKDGFLEA